MLNKTLGFMTSIAIGFGAAQAASAADLPTKALLSPAPAYSWTGFYIGGSVGAGWGTNDVTLASAVGPGFPATAFNLPIAQLSRSGIVGGGQAGYNYQTGWVVVGVQGDIAGTGIKGTTPCASFLTVVSCSASDNWLATVSGRVGGLVGDRTLVYVKGGGAFLNSNYSGNIPAIFNRGTALQSSATNAAAGWLFGFGVEYLFAAHWTGFIEYNYMDFGSNNVNFNSFPGGLLPNGSVATMAITTKLSVAKAGVNYKF